MAYFILLIRVYLSYDKYTTIKLHVAGMPYQGLCR